MKEETLWAFMKGITYIFKREARANYNLR